MVQARRVDLFSNLMHTVIYDVLLCRPKIDAVIILIKLLLGSFCNVALIQYERCNYVIIPNAVKIMLTKKYFISLLSTVLYIPPYL